MAPPAVSKRGRNATAKNSKDVPAKNSKDVPAKNPKDVLAKNPKVIVRQKIVKPIPRNFGRAPFGDKPIEAPVKKNSVFEDSALVFNPEIGQNQWMSKADAKKLKSPLFCTSSASEDEGQGGASAANKTTGLNRVQTSSEGLHLTLPSSSGIDGGLSNPAVSSFSSGPLTQADGFPTVSHPAPSFNGGQIPTANHPGPSFPGGRSALPSAIRPAPSNYAGQVTQPATRPAARMAFSDRVDNAAVRHTASGSGSVENPNRTARPKLTTDPWAPERVQARLQADIRGRERGGAILQALHREALKAKQAKLGLVMPHQQPVNLKRKFETEPSPPNKRQAGQNGSVRSASPTIDGRYGGGDPSERFILTPRSLSKTTRRGPSGVIVNPVVAGHGTPISTSAPRPDGTSARRGRVVSGTMVGRRATAGANATPVFSSSPSNNSEQQVEDTIVNAADTPTKEGGKRRGGLAAPVKKAKVKPVY